MAFSMMLLIRRFAGVSEGAMDSPHDDIINIGTFERRGRA